MEEASAADRLKILGHHVLPSDQLLFDFLCTKVQDPNYNSALFDFPVIERNLYSGEPWEVLNNNDPWDIVCNSNEVKRVIYVFTYLKPCGKTRFVRYAGDGKWDGATGDVNILSNAEGSVTMVRRYFDFKLGDKDNPEYQEKGQWKMHEYMLKPVQETKIALCQITHVVNKDLGLHRVWPKTPLDMCFHNFKNLGFFAKRSDKRPLLSTDDQQDVQHKRLKLIQDDQPSTSTSTCFETGFDDYIDLSFLDSIECCEELIENFQ